MTDYPPSGVLFTNTRKKPDTKQPDYTGNLELPVERKHHETECK